MITAVLGENFDGNLLACTVLLANVNAAVAALTQEFGHVDGVTLNLLH